MDHETYFRQLLEREGAAVAIPYCAVRHTDWEPAKNACHGNVDYWVTRHPGAKPVRGWLFWGPGEDGRYNIMAHSVVDEAGTLVDITPIDENTPREGLRFLRHLGSEEEFSALKVRFSQFFYPFISREDWLESQLPIREQETDF